ncbi:MAG TPA: hypothetical protein VFP84_31100 [Kofleriaceae bacterium]|nr:hypothetical protein [Kofleriaceae bacterium]
MAGRSFVFAPIAIVDLTHVTGGVDKQTAAAQQVIDQATAAAQKVAKAVAPKDDHGMSQLLMHLMNTRGSGAGPTPAPALPPTSHLTR